MGLIHSDVSLNVACGGVLDALGRNIGEGIEALFTGATGFSPETPSRGDATSTAHCSLCQHSGTRLLITLAW